MFFFALQKVFLNEHVVPNQQRRYAKWKLSRNAYTLHTHSCTFGAHLHAQSVLIDKNFCIGAQSEIY